MREQYLDGSGPMRVLHSGLDQQRINSNLEKHNERENSRAGATAEQPRISVHYDWIPFHHYQSDRVNMVLLG